MCLAQGPRHSDASEARTRGLQADLGPHCLSLRFLKHFSRREKQTTFVAIGALRVKRNMTFQYKIRLGSKNKFCALIVLLLLLLLILFLFLFSLYCTFKDT